MVLGLYAALPKADFCAGGLFRVVPGSLDGLYREHRNGRLQPLRTSTPVACKTRFTYPFSPPLVISTDQSITENERITA